MKLLAKLLIILVVVSLFTYCIPSCTDLVEIRRLSLTTLPSTCSMEPLATYRHFLR